MSKDYTVITPNGETITIEEYMETEDYDNRKEFLDIQELTNQLFPIY